MKLNNKLTELLEIKYPIFQGGMAWVATGELAAAVSSAGGLGIIGAGSAPPEKVAEEIDKVKGKTNQPFGVNVMLLSPHVDEIVELVIEREVPVVTTGAGNPGKYMADFRQAGIKVFPVVPSVALARRIERLDVQGIIAEGNEAGGHIGRLSTMALIPQIVDSVDLPVIAAGGIGDGRGAAAAFMLGADGVQLGTRFICAKECIAHTNYKQAIINAKDRDAVVTGRSTGHPVRNLKNKLTHKMNQLEDRGASPEKIEELGKGSLRRAVQEGDTDYGTVMAGQIAGLINKIKPADEILSDIIDELKESWQKESQKFEVTV